MTVNRIMRIDLIRIFTNLVGNFIEVDDKLYTSIELQ
jgi:hypothetical protein